MRPSNVYRQVIKHIGINKKGEGEAHQVRVDGIDHGFFETKIVSNKGEAHLFLFPQKKGATPQDWQTLEMLFNLHERLEWNWNTGPVHSFRFQNQKPKPEKSNCVHLLLHSENLITVEPQKSPSGANSSHRH